MFRVSTERKILSCQITLSSVYLLLKGTLLIYLFRKFEKVNLEVNQSDALMPRSTNLSSHSSSNFSNYSIGMTPIDLSHQDLQKIGSTVGCFMKWI